ncbi:hypothetical protein GALL_414730 [mine drainage metagenome]|jgi:hypothetical protein|uniref:Uncharacterized protein n=1 Tax=mine drainage metagenome TaxID=410659 RepID=A0A1J5Q0N9_9ZZZZ
MDVARELEKLHERICAILDCAAEEVVLRATVDGLIALRSYELAKAHSWAHHASRVGTADELLQWAQRARLTK